MKASEIDRVIKAHDRKLAPLLALEPDPKDWQRNGSIEYHRECIGHLEKMRTAAISAARPVAPTT